MTVLDHYRAIDAVSLELVHAAREGDWDRVALARQQCAALIERLKAHDATQPLTPADNDERLRLLRRMVVHEGEARRLQTPGARFVETLLERIGSSARNTTA